VSREKFPSTSRPRGRLRLILLITAAPAFRNRLLLEAPLLVSRFLTLVLLLPTGCGMHPTERR
jgi:hypothetical protein